VPSGGASSIIPMGTVGRHEIKGALHCKVSIDGCRKRPGALLLSTRGRAGRYYSTVTAEKGGGEVLRDGQSFFKT